MFRPLTAFALCLLTVALHGQVSSGNPDFSASFDGPDRTWLGPHFWANRLQDWRLEKGRAVCVADPGLPFRSAHLIGRRLRRPRDFAASLVVEAVTGGAPGALGGLLIGAGRADGFSPDSALVHAWTGPGTGWFVGIDAYGRPQIRELDQPDALENGEPAAAESAAVLPAGAQRILRVRYEASEGALVLDVVTRDGSTTASTRRAIAAERLRGNIALVSHGGRPAGVLPTRFAFDDLRIRRSSLSIESPDRLGPILCAPYTYSRRRLSMTVQLMPDAFLESSRVRFELEGNEPGTWLELAESPVEGTSCTASFRLPIDIPERRRFRLTYDRSPEDSSEENRFFGSIGPDPGNTEPLRLVATNCMHQNAHALGTKRTDWTRHVWFPHRDLVTNVERARPHLLFFAGDQIYEGRSPTFADRKHLRLDYLYKWYLWGWTWRDLLRHTPAVVIPDDHDVYQGNLWGEKGRPAKRDHFGGYVHPAWFVQMVERTQTGHLPAPVDPEPVDQGIGVYFTELLYGAVSFAILEDRKFKSGCKRPTMPPSGTGRPDHFDDPAFDRRQLDLEGLKLLGDRQLAFLEDWAGDWRGAEMKAALSQTHFANMATHHGARLRPLLADLDSNGWPQTGRRRAIEALRRAGAVHICGDQHLSTLIRHGLDRHRDAGWAFCVPAAANFYPRAFFPDAPKPYRHPAPEEFLGDRVDGFGNLVSVFAATNPGLSMGQPNPILHDQMPGYGVIVFDTDKRTIRFEAWPRFADPRHDRPYAGWPRTVAQSEGDGREHRFTLPQIRVAGLDEPVIQVREAASGRLVHALRIPGDRYRPRVAEAGTYRITVGEPDRDLWKELGSFEATPTPPDPIVAIF